MGHKKAVILDGFFIFIVSGVLGCRLRLRWEVVWKLK